MSDKVQMTEEEFEGMIYSIMGNYIGYSISVIKSNARKHGYIIPDPVEEAEEEYRAYKEGKNCFVAEIVMDKMYVAIHHLKAKLKEREK